LQGLVKACVILGLDVEIEQGVPQRRLAGMVGDRPRKRIERLFAFAEK